MCSYMDRRYGEIVEVFEEGQYVVNCVDGLLLVTDSEDPQPVVGKVGLCMCRPVAHKRVLSHFLVAQVYWLPDRRWCMRAGFWAFLFHMYSRDTLLHPSLCTGICISMRLARSV